RRRSARLSRSARRDRGGRDRSLNAGRRQLSAPPLKDFPAGVDVWPMTARVSAGPRTALAPSRWIDRWLAACSELAELERSNPMTDAVIDEIDGRMIRVGEKRLADFASCRGARLKRFGFEDVEDLERLLKEGGPAPRLVCIDGVNSMTGNAADIPAFARVAREYDALLYVDDAHGFGVIGERSGDELS